MRAGVFGVLVLLEVRGSFIVERRLFLGTVEEYRSLVSCLGYSWGLMNELRKDACEGISR